MVNFNAHNSFNVRFVAHFPGRPRCPSPPFETSQESGFALAGWIAPRSLDDEAFETIGQTVRHAAGAIDGLKDILERLQNSVAQATEQRRNDIEIGQLFTRAQEFVDGAVNEGHELAQRIIADAEFEAARIIAAAKQEAHGLIEEGRYSASLPSDAVRALQATIVKFARMNSMLVEELSNLNGALVTRESQPTASTRISAEGLSQLEFEGTPRAAEPQQSGLIEDRADGNVIEGPQPEQQGYWSIVRERGRQAPSARLGRHSAPDAQWRTH